MLVDPVLTPSLSWKDLLLGNFVGSTEGEGENSLLGYLYNKKILEKIGGLIGRVVKLDFNTDKRYDRVKDFCSFSTDTKGNVGEKEGVPTVDPMTRDLILKRADSKGKGAKDVGSVIEVAELDNDGHGCESRLGGQSEKLGSNFMVTGPIVGTIVDQKLVVEGGIDVGRGTIIPSQFQKV
ncbi:hypothetical protein GOBAR_DD13784 [Gossypium barbadense]|nr:hypothetical protein GOBAR_DD13784 [Gossypium barbadense]